MRLQIFHKFIRKQHKCLSWWLQITTEEWKICNSTTILGVTLPRFYTYIENPMVGFYVLYVLNMHAKWQGRGRGNGISYNFLLTINKVTLIQSTTSKGIFFIL